MLQSMGSWRVRHDLATEQSQETFWLGGGIREEKRVWTVTNFWEMVLRDPSEVLVSW